MRCDRTGRGHMTSGTSLEIRLRNTVKGHVPGIAVAVVDADGIRDAVGVGMADLACGEPASPEMVCPWFSMTKIATATAAMQLAERGALDLDAPLASHVPQMQHLRPASDAAKITARHLLSHSAGLANPIPVGWIHPLDQTRSRPRHVPGRSALEAREAPLRAGREVELLEPRDAGAGSSDGEPHGDPFSDLVRRGVLDPFGMDSTGFAYSPAMEARSATGYHPRRSPMRFHAQALGDRSAGRSMGLPQPLHAGWSGVWWFDRSRDRCGTIRQDASPRGGARWRPRARRFLGTRDA